jgi:hypothetical protein
VREAIKDNIEVGELKKLLFAQRLAATRVGGLMETGMFLGEYEGELGETLAAALDEVLKEWERI